MATEKELLKIKKVQALAENGIGGEKTNAKKILKKLLKKYDLIENDILSEDKEMFTKKLKQGHKTKLFILILSKFLSGDSFDEMWFSNNSYSKIYHFDATIAEHIDIEESYNFYIKLFEEEKDRLLHAFFIRHNIFGKPDPKNPPTEEEELAADKAANMAYGLSNEEPDIKKRLNSGE